MVRLGLLAAALLVVLYRISSTGTCDALSVPYPEGKYRVQRDLAAAPAAPTLFAGDTYRPPIVDMKYGGGPVLWQPIHLYFVWYGTWTEAQKNLIRTASESLTPTTIIQEYPNLSNYWSVVTEYYQELPGDVRRYASNDVSIAGEVDDPYSLGTTIDMSLDPIKIIESHIVGQRLPSDLAQGVYFLFSSADVGFIAKPEQCGYHNTRCVVQNSDCNNPVNHIVYSYVPIKIPNCAVFGGSALSGLPPNHLVDSDMDSMIITYLHELLELTVNPYWSTSPAWRANMTNIQTEASDMCGYNFVAGDWYYCDFTDIYPDFKGEPCSSLNDHHTALIEPNSDTTFNVYGAGGSNFIVQQFWSLGSKGCVLQIEEASCPGSAVMLSDLKGTIQRGQFFNGVGLQRYAAGGQTCTWNIAVPNAISINLYFDTVALGYNDQSDYVTVSDGNSLIQTLTGFGTKISVPVTGNTAVIEFVSDGTRSPTPSSAGFIMRYEAGF
ncbi:hypothetical protein M758_11G153900 [Ceratodon purpureus]|nr:hypothetical protein M758_11G153900 [Ceratodon purpureus]